MKFFFEMDQLMVFIDFLPMIDYVRAWFVCKAWLVVSRQWKKRRYPHLYCYPIGSTPSKDALALMSMYGYKWLFGTDVSHPIALRVARELGERQSGMFQAAVPYGFRKCIDGQYFTVDFDQYIRRKLAKYYRTLRHEPELFTQAVCRAYNFANSYQGNYVNEMNDYLTARYP